MNRAWLSLAAFFGLVLLVSQNAFSVVSSPTSITNHTGVVGVPDTLVIGRNDMVTLTASWDSVGGVAADSVFGHGIAWAMLSGPLGGSFSISTGTDRPEATVQYSETYRPPTNGVYKLRPYLTAFVDSVGGGVGDASLFSADTTTIIVKDLWYPASFKYEGSFRVRRGVSEDNGVNSMDRTGCRGMTYCPTGNAGADTSLYLPGSLFIYGQDQGGYVAEFSIPKPVDSPLHTLSQLPYAEFLQPLQDATQGRYAAYPHGTGNRRETGDLLWVPSQANYPYPSLWFTMKDLYNGPSTDRSSIGRCRTTLNDPHAAGLWHIGPVDDGNANHDFHTSVTSDYMFLAPLSWANAYTGGRFVISGMGDREAGTNGACQGPGMYAWSPDLPDLPVGAEIDAIKIAHYPTFPWPGNECDSARTGSQWSIPGYNQEDSWTDGCWMNHDGRQAVVIFGNKCRYGAFYHQTPDECHDECCDWDGGVCGQNQAGWVCGQDQLGDTDPAYIAKAMFFDPDLLGRAALGQINPWEVVPYAILDMTPFIYQPGWCSSNVQGVTYDGARGRVFVAQQHVDTEQSGNVPDHQLIHSFLVSTLPTHIADLTIDAPFWSYEEDTLSFVADWSLVSSGVCSVASDSARIILMVDGVVADSTSSKVLPPYVFDYDTGTTVFTRSHRAQARLSLDEASPCGGYFDSEPHQFVIIPQP